MGDMADDFRAMKQHQRDMRNKTEPQRIDYAIKLLHNSGHRMDKTLDETKFLVDDFVDFWPYTGWWSGKGIGSGRGVKNLLKQLEQQEEDK